ncbi:hypothetical protein [Actinopolyspora halophila]|uniref:hypothetical protein n=1 Tax=Actinopolyspora halophila TaxID=1850 RepID=UPI00039DA3EB|nr:hypothetical protein [Actinopolyspora halophila]
MKLRKRAATVLGASAVVLAGLVTPGTAAAADEPTVRQLLEQCEQGNTDLCEFHPSGPPESYRGADELVGGAANCSEGTSTRIISWESTQTTTNSVGVTISASSTLGEVFEVGFETSYQREWSWSTSKSDEIRHELGPGQAVEIHAAPMREKVTGTYEMHFGDPYYGHYYWYVHNVTVDGPAQDQAWFTRVEEVDANC